MNLATECCLLMSKEYSWRDGWAYTYPKPLPKPVPLIERERVARCSCTGIYVAENHTCPLCDKTMEGTVCQ